MFLSLPPSLALFLSMGTYVYVNLEAMSGIFFLECWALLMVAPAKEVCKLKRALLILFGFYYNNNPEVVNLLCVWIDLNECEYKFNSTMH